jgi:ABC-2 type transport system permease protein
MESYAEDKPPLSEGTISATYRVSVLRGMWIIWRRELAAYFASPIAYFLIFAALLMMGLAFNNDVAVRNGIQPTDGAEVLRYLAQFTLFLAPLITMRLFAEENREGTIELLMTLPVRENSIVFGKFLGAWAFYSVLLSLTIIHQAVLIWLSPPDLGVVIASYLGLWLLGGAMIAVGMVFSAFTDSQIIAAFTSGVALLLLWQADQVGGVLTNRPLAEFIRLFSFQSNFSYSFAIGFVRLENIVFFLGIIALMVFITIQILESRRWR